MTDTLTALPAAAAAPHMTELRQHLLGTLADLRSRTNPMEPDRARAIASVASVLVDSAKVEVDYLRATGQDSSSFLEQPADPAVAHLGQIPASGYTQGVVQRLEGVTTHRMKG